MEPQKKRYRRYSKFNEQLFLTELKNEDFNYNESIDPDLLYQDFIGKYNKILSKHAPIKVKTQRGNQSNFMNKELSKAIMSRSRLRNKFNKNKTPENWEKYRIQRNKCTSINKKAKKDFFKNEMKNANPQQARFWQILKPYITDKGHHNNEDYMLEEKGEIIKDKHKISKIFNEYYINIVEHSTSKNTYLSLSLVI